MRRSGAPIHVGIVACVLVSLVGLSSSAYALDNPGFTATLTKTVENGSTTLHWTAENCFDEDGRQSKIYFKLMRETGTSIKQGNAKAVDQTYVLQEDGSNKTYSLEAVCQRDPWLDPWYDMNAQRVVVEAEDITPLPEPPTKPEESPEPGQSTQPDQPNELEPSGVPELPTEPEKPEEPQNPTESSAPEVDPSDGGASEHVEAPIIDQAEFLTSEFGRTLTWAVSGCSKLNQRTVTVDVLLDGQPLRMQTHSAKGSTNASQWPAGDYDVLAQCVSLPDHTELSRATKSVSLNNANLSLTFAGDKLDSLLPAPGHRVRISSQPTHNPLTFEDGSALPGSFAPGETVDVSVIIGDKTLPQTSLSADSAGNIEAIFWLPEDQEATSFRVEATGQNTGHSLYYGSQVLPRHPEGIVLDLSVSGTVHVTSSRQQADTLNFAKNSTVQLKLISPNGAVLQRWTAQADDAGHLDAVFDLPSDLPQGRYTVLAAKPFSAGSYYDAYFDVEKQQAAPSASPSAASSALPSASPSVSSSATNEASPTPSPSAEPSLSPSGTPSVVPSATPSVSVSASPSVAPSASTSPSQSVEPAVSPSRTASEQPKDPGEASLATPQTTPVVNQSESTKPSGPTASASSNGSDTLSAPTDDNASASPTFVFNPNEPTNSTESSVNSENISSAGAVQSTDHAASTPSKHSTNDVKLPNTGAVRGVIPAALVLIASGAALKLRSRQLKK